MITFGSETFDLSRIRACRMGFSSLSFSVLWSLGLSIGTLLPRVKVVRFFAGLLFSIDKELDLDESTDQISLLFFCEMIADEKKLNATYIVSVARKLGCSIFLLPEDIMEVKRKPFKSFFFLNFQI